MSAPTSEIPGSSIDADLEVGRQVDQYVVESKLGQGAFGTVFKAAHPLIGKIVAIKVLARRFSVDPEMVSRFVEEARAVNQIRHHNIIDIFAFDQLPDGRHYYVMEYLDGETLDALLAREQRLPLAQVLPILRAIGKALDAAHAKGIAHRDLKPENVFLGKDPDGGVFPKLLDFGIAKLLAPDEGLKHKTRTGAPIGTPYFMSPEQCRGRDVDHRTDIYAFGVLAYVLLTGKYPFDGDDYMSILMKQISEQPVPPSTLAPELPVEIDETVAWLMQKQPADRPDNLRAAFKALEHAAQQAKLITSIPTSAWDVQTGPVVSPYKTKAPNTATAGITGAPPLSATDAGTLERPPRSKAPMIAIGGVAAIAIAAAAWFATRPGSPAAHVSSQAPASAPALAPAPAPAPAPTPTPSPPPPPPAPVSENVIVTVEGVPEGTDVLVGATSIGVAPGPVQLRRGDDPVVLLFKTDGYLPASRSIIPHDNQSLTVSLKKKPSHRTGTKPTRGDIIDVFGGKKK